jgi:hypothetical protein
MLTRATRWGAIEPSVTSAARAYHRSRRVILALPGPGVMPAASDLSTRVGPYEAIETVRAGAFSLV